MIKARAEGRNGREVVLLGLSRVNCERLLAGRPLWVDGRELGIDNDVVIYGGEDEAELAAVVTGGRTPASGAVYTTCCEKHAAAAGLEHRPGPAPVDCTGMP